MNNIDLAKIVADKVDSCPNCGNKLQQIDSFLIQCPYCALGIAVKSGRERKWQQITTVALVVATCVMGVGVIIGLGLR